MSPYGRRRECRQRLVVEPRPEQRTEVDAGHLGRECDEVGGRTGAVPVSRRPGAEHLEERVVADRRAAGRAGSGRRACRPGRRTSASGPGSPSTRSCGNLLEPSPVLDGARSGPTGSGLLGPQPLGVAGEALVQPDVAASAPSVTLLPNHWCDSSWATSRTAPSRRRGSCEPNIARPCASRGISSSSVGDDDGIGRERVRPEQPLERRHHLGLPAERRVRPAVHRGRVDGPERDRRRRTAR